MNKLNIILPLLLISTSAFSSDSPNWTYVEGSYIKVEIDDADEEPDGFGIAGSALLGDNFILNANYRSVSEDVLGYDVDLNFTSLGFGMRYGATDTTDIFGIISYENIELDVEDFGDEDESGYGVRIGARSMLTDSLELTGAIGYIDIDGESETSLMISGYYHLNSTFAFGLGYEAFDDFDILNASVRASF